LKSQKNITKRIISIIIFSAIAMINLGDMATARIYFFYDAESGTPGDYLPWGVDVDDESFYPVSWIEGDTVRGTVENTETTPDGNNYVNLRIPLAENTATHQLKHRDNWAAYSMDEDSVIYLAYYHNAKSLDGSDIWRETSQSASKSIGLDMSGTRWSNTFGHWTDEAHENSVCYGNEYRWDSFAPNDDHYYSIYIGNPTYHINLDMEPMGPNANGYTCTNQPQFAYNEWHMFVMAVKLSSVGGNGYVKFWADGVMTHEILDINTVEAGQIPPYSFKYIELVGTTSQAYNDHPVHDRMFDKIMLTDNWQDIVDGGYLKGVEVDTTAPAVPSGVGVE